MSEQYADIAEKILLENFTDVSKIDDNRKSVQRRTFLIIERCRTLIAARIGDANERMEMLDDFINDRAQLFVSRSLLKEIYEEAKKSNNSEHKGTFIQPLSLEDSLIDFYKNGFDSGLEFTLWPSFSRYLRMAKREMTVITGIPGHGKSEFVDAMAVQLMGTHGWRFAVFSPENYPHDVHLEKLLSKICGKPFHHGPSERMSEEEVRGYLKILDEHFTFISPDEGYMSLDGVIGITNNIVDKRPIDCLIIDPWNSIENDRPRDRSETEWLGQSLNRCRDYCRKSNIALWIVAHPAKMQKEKDKDFYKVPQPYDIAGSANWANKADNCISVYRSAEEVMGKIEPYVEVFIQKVKFKMRGMTGSVRFNYNRATGIYTERI